MYLFEVHLLQCQSSLCLPLFIEQVQYIYIYIYIYCKCWGNTKIKPVLNRKELISSWKFLWHKPIFWQSSHESVRCFYNLDSFWTSFWWNTNAASTNTTYILWKIVKYSFNLANVHYILYCHAENKRFSHHSFLPRKIQLLSRYFFFLTCHVL